MEAPVRLRYLGRIDKKFGEKTVYRSYDPGVEGTEQEKVVNLDSTGERYPNERVFSWAFAAHCIRDFPDEFEVLDDPDGSLRAALSSFIPKPKGVASKNIQIIQPDGSVKEFPPGSIIQVTLPGAEPIVKVAEPEEVAKVEAESPPPEVKQFTRKDLDKLSKPKIKRLAKANYNTELDDRPIGEGGQSKVQMVDAYLELQGG